VENADNNDVNDKSKQRAYKTVCAKLGLLMCVYFICRYLTGVAAGVVSSEFGNMSRTALLLTYNAVVVLLVYVIPLIFAVLIFKSKNVYKGKMRELYKKPKRLARALGAFPAMFGLGYGVALLTLIISLLLTWQLGGETLIADLIRPTTVEPTTDIASMIMMIILLVVIAPVFEEFLARGIIYDALKPYGTGLAIIISSLLFGLMHGSLYMLFYTTAYGFALGYIRYATNSLFVVTILHAIVNSIGAAALLLITLMQITGEENRVINTFNAIYLVAVLAMIIIGIIVFIAKIPSIRKFKIENTWTQISPWKKTAIFFMSAPVIIMMILAFNEITQNWLLNLIFR
jgi:membrane protease YdiL (CAAX protease family)